MVAVFLFCYMDIILTISFHSDIIMGNNSNPQGKLVTEAMLGQAWLANPPMSCMLLSNLCLNNYIKEHTYEQL